MTFFVYMSSLELFFAVRKFSCRRRKDCKDKDILSKYGRFQKDFDRADALSIRSHLSLEKWQNIDMTSAWWQNTTSQSHHLMFGFSGTAVVLGKLRAPVDCHCDLPCLCRSVEA